MQKRIYADHAATTALSPAAFAAMQPWLQEKYGNPSTLYGLAREPRKALAAARETIAHCIGATSDEIFFTSGGSEADNWALKGAAFLQTAGKRIVTSAIEHHAILHSCASLERMGYQITTLPVDGEGVLKPEMLIKNLSEDVILVSVMLANNEIGTIEPVAELTKVAHQCGCLFHTDAVQGVGHIPINVKTLGVDFLSASAHKFNGPKGIGFLYIKQGVEILPLIDGGGQEHNMRAGTENLAGIVGMATALKEHTDHMEAESKYLNGLAERLIAGLMASNLDFKINGSEYRIPGNLSLSFRGIDGEVLLHRLDLMGTCIATGSACNSEETVLSHVIQAIKVPKEYAHGTIRITFGMDNDAEQVDRIVQQLVRILRI